MLFRSASGRGALTSSLGGQLFAGSLASGRLAGSLLSTSHVERREFRDGIKSCTRLQGIYIASASRAEKTLSSLFVIGGARTWREKMARTEFSQSQLSWGGRGGYI